jgi:hypothetical protein
MTTPKGWSIGLGLLIAAGVATPASAQVDKCQPGLAKVSQSLQIQLSKSFDKCLATIRKAIVKGTPPSKPATSCEKAFDKIFGLGSVPADKTKIGKFVAAVAKLEAQLRCTSAELGELGHLVSGINAPGSADTDFVASWLAVVKQQMAWNENLANNGSARDLIDYALAAGPDGDDPANCDPSRGTGCGTDCSGAPPPGYVYRPNLCALDARAWPQCRVAACHLKVTGAAIQPLGAPVSLNNRKFALEVCTPPAAILPVTGADFVFLASGPTSTFQPPPSIPTSPAVTWCIDQVRAEGWCDCTGNGIAYEPDTCVDHLADLSGTCAADPNEAEFEADCVCTSPAGQPCTTPGCTQCRNATNGARCHPRARNSKRISTYSGSSGANDCMLLSTLQFRFLSPGTCVDADGNPLGPCTSIGAATAPCLALGGVSCDASVGPDGVACTPDDLPTALETMTIPFTTGTAAGIIESYNQADGVCLAGNVGMNCMTNADCDTTVPPNGSCAASIAGCSTGPNPEDCMYSTAAGLGVSCTAMRAGNLTNFALTGALPLIDEVPELEDYLITFKLDCN